VTAALAAAMGIGREGWTLIGFVALAVAGVAVTVAGAILLVRQRRRS
jgi:hypothetical protein